MGFQRFHSYSYNKEACTPFFHAVGNISAGDLISFVQRTKARKDHVPGRVALFGA